MKNATGFYVMGAVHALAGLFMLACVMAGVTHINGLPLDVMGAEHASELGNWQLWGGIAQAGIGRLIQAFE